MTPARHQRMRCPLLPSTMVSLLPVTKGHCSAWPSGGRRLPGQQEEEGSAVPAGASSPCLLCGPSQWIPSPYLGRAGAKGVTGLLKHPAASTQQGPVTALGTHCTPWLPCPMAVPGNQTHKGEQGRPTVPGQLALPHSPHHQTWLVTKAQSRHSLLCGSSLLALKRKSTREGAATPRPSALQPCQRAEEEGPLPSPIQPPSLWPPSTSSCNRAWLSPGGDTDRHGPESGQQHQGKKRQAAPQ